MFLYLIVTVLTLVYFVLKRKHSYWKNKDVPHTIPSIIFGNYEEQLLRKKNLGQTIEKLCYEFPEEKYIGAYYMTEPVLIPTDPEIIKLIVTKDFYYFNGRQLSDHVDKFRVTSNLFSQSGDQWKVVRQNLTPLFTSAKMKNMFHLIEKCSYEYEKMIDREVAASDVHEAKHFVSNFTMECITECAFGVKANTMGKDPEASPFKKVSKFLDDNSAIKFYLENIFSVYPSLFALIPVELMKKEMDFFHHLTTSVMAQRGYKPSGRNDFIDLIVNWKTDKEIIGDKMKNAKSGCNEKVALEVDDNLLVAQCFIFFAAGFETSATASSYTLFELAKHQDAQKRVLEEVDAYIAHHENKVNYECLSEMPYLEACIDEALRVYPVLGMIPRETMDDYVLPGGVKVEKGLRVHLPVHYLHHNPKYFDNPEEYRPERFFGDAKKLIKPYTYMPFGEGPRMCIGMRFAKMQMIAGMITMLKKYRVELADDMPEKVTFEPTSFVTQAVGGIRLKFITRDGWENRMFNKNI